MRRQSSSSPRTSHCPGASYVTAPIGADRASCGKTALYRSRYALASSRHASRSSVLISWRSPSMQQTLASRPLRPSVFKMLRFSSPQGSGNRAALLIDSICAAVKGMGDGKASGAVPGRDGRFKTRSRRLLGPHQRPRSAQKGFEIFLIHAKRSLRFWPARATGSNRSKVGLVRHP